MDRPAVGHAAGLRRDRASRGPQERVAVCVGHVAAYPAGFELELLSFGAPGADVDDPWLLHPRRTPGRSATALRFGLRFADGAKVTNLAGGTGDPPTAPVMHDRGGHGGDGEWTQRYWVWPLPPPGDLALVCEWPAMDLLLAEVAVDAQPILDAAARAQVVFARREPPTGEGGSTVVGWTA